MIEDIRQRVGEDAFNEIPMFQDVDLDYMPTQINLEMGIKRWFYTVLRLITVQMRFRR